MKMKTTAALAAFCLFCCGTFAHGAPEQANSAPSNTLPAARAAWLKKGVNITRWLWWAQNNPGYHQHIASIYDKQDLALLHSLGIRHIRLTLDPTLYFNASQPQQLRTDYLEDLDHVISLIVSQDLAVIVAPFPNKEFKAKLDDEEGGMAKFALFWEALAKHLSSTDPNRVFLEVMNEPSHKHSPEWWAASQKQILDAMRRGAPEHTLIANSNQGSDGTELINLVPFDDPNIIYNFHFYEPHTFTHQGIMPPISGINQIKELAYPVDPENKAKVGALVTNGEGKKHLAQYDATAQTLTANIVQTADWARRHHVTVTCNEFGVNNGAPRESCLRWLSDVRKALEQNDIGWALWDYSGDAFGMAHPNIPGQRIPDPEYVKALGLTQAPVNCP
jgi:hypothetical protein